MDDTNISQYIEGGFDPVSIKKYHIIVCAIALILLLYFIFIKENKCRIPLTGQIDINMIPDFTNRRN